MAERLDETGVGFMRSQTTENVDTIPRQDVSSTPPSSDQMEADAVASNEAGGSVVLSNMPKLMTLPASCLKEICVVRKISIPQYITRSEVGMAHMKIFTMEAWVPDMDLRVTGQGKTKKEAKHEAATRVLEKLCAASERNESLNRVTSEVVKKCNKMLKDFALVEPQSSGSESENTCWKMRRIQFSPIPRFNARSLWANLLGGVRIHISPILLSPPFNAGSPRAHEMALEITQEDDFNVMLEELIEAFENLHITE